MRVFVIYSLAGETYDTVVKIESVTFSEEVAKAEVMRKMADECRSRSLMEATGAYVEYTTYYYEEVKTLDELKVVGDHHGIQV
jgi:hypothetical protein